MNRRWLHQLLLPYCSKEQIDLTLMNCIQEIINSDDAGVETFALFFEVMYMQPVADKTGGDDMIDGFRIVDDSNLTCAD